MLGFHPISSAPVSSLRTTAVAAPQQPENVYSKSAIPARQKYLSTTLRSVWVDLSPGAAIVEHALVYSKSFARKSRQVHKEWIWNDLESAIAAPFDVPIYSSNPAKVNQKHPVTNLWVDYSPAAFVNSEVPVYSQNIAKRSFRRGNGLSWIELPQIVFGTAVSPISINRGKHPVRRNAIYGKSWVDLHILVGELWTNQPCLTTSYTTLSCSTTPYTNVPCGTVTWNNLT